MTDPSLDQMIAEAKQMQADGKYINGTIFHALVAEIERLREENEKLEGDLYSALYYADPS